MDGIKSKIEEDARRALKNRETGLLGTLRLLLAAVHNREIEKRAKSGGPEELTDEELLAVLHSEARKRRDAIAEFQKAGRRELAERESLELEIIGRYLPPELPDAELEKIVQEVVKEIGAVERRDIGKVIGAVMKLTAGRAVGERVRETAARLLPER